MNHQQVVEGKLNTNDKISSEKTGFIFMMLSITFAMSWLNVFGNLLFHTVLLLVYLALGILLSNKKMVFFFS